VESAGDPAAIMRTDFGRLQPSDGMDGSQLLRRVEEMIFPFEAATQIESPPQLSIPSSPVLLPAYGLPPGSWRRARGRFNRPQ